MTDLVVKLTKTINAPIEKVFNAWLDADTLSQFMMPIAGMPQPRVEADGREGGSFAIYMMVGDNEIPHRGQYLKVEKPNKLVFTWESPFSTDDSTVTILFNSIDETTTEINFTHLKFKDEQARSNHEGGWGTILEYLSNTTNPSAAAQKASA